MSNQASDVHSALERAKMMWRYSANSIRVRGCEPHQKTGYMAATPLFLKYWNESFAMVRASIYACLITQRDGRPNFFGVADGVGGGAHGEIASYVLLEHLANAASKIVSDPLTLARWIQEADGEVCSALSKLTDRPGASTCVTVWLHTDTDCLLTH